MKPTTLTFYMPAGACHAFYYLLPSAPTEHTCWFYLRFTNTTWTCLPCRPCCLPCKALPTLYLPNLPAAACLQDSDSGGMNDGRHAVCCMMPTPATTLLCLKCYPTFTPSLPGYHHHHVFYYLPTHASCLACKLVLPCLLPFPFYLPFSCGLLMPYPWFWSIL